MLYGLVNFTSGVSFNHEKDMPDLTGEVILVTGGNTGLGKESIFQLAQHNPAHIYLAARSSARALAAIESIKAALPSDKACPPITFIQCDLASLPSIVGTAREFVSKEKRLNRLFLNAGVMPWSGAVTEQGYEAQFGTNHMGHALLTKLLLPTLLRTAEEAGDKADVRVVTLSSVGHITAPRNGIEFDELKKPMDTFTASSGARYGQSKLANILFAKELARRYPSIKSMAVHPGVVQTELFRSTSILPVSVVNIATKLFLTSVPNGVKNQLWAGTGTGVESGEYYMPVGRTGQGSALSNNVELANKLWEWTEKELEGYNL